MKSINLELKANVEIKFNAYCHLKGTSPESLLSELVTSLVSENEPAILDWLKAGNAEDQGTSEVAEDGDKISIYRNYKGKRYEAIFSKKSRKVNFNSVWMAPSRAAVQISGNNINGWRWWKYINEKGQRRLIEDFRV